MKNYKNNLSRWAGLLGAGMLLAAPFSFTSCKEDISEDAYAIKSMQTMMDCINATDTLTEIKALFDEVRLGRSSNASVLSSVLSARGNYTVFAPSNKAVKLHLQKVTGKEDATLADLTLEQKELIALNCIIDNGSNNAFEIADFPNDGGTFSISNLKDRRLACEQNDQNDYVINGNAVVTQSNVEVSNGMLHVVDHVIAPSTNSVAELVQRADNMRILGHLLKITGWADALAVNTESEEEYELANMSYAGSTRRFVGFNFPYMEKRGVGYTVFAETDDVYKNQWGLPDPVYDEVNEELTNWDAMKDAFKTQLAAALGVDASTISDDYTSPTNPINQFVAYHILDGGMATDEFVHHHNEYGYDYGTDLKNPLKSGYTVNVWDYYTTKGEPRGLLKITQLPDEPPLEGQDGARAFYLNRISSYDNGFDGDYHELSCIANTATNGMNIKVEALNGDNDNNALNGFYFPINAVLVNSKDVCDQLGRERLRIDISTMLPEIASNDLRGRSARYFPQGYFSNITNESQGTQIYYLQDGYVASNGAWKDYQGDEILASGRFDFVLKLPPVPKDGYYELRMGASLNNQRCMVQVYIGEDPLSTTPIGLPIDERETVAMIPGQPWVADTGDEVTDRENDRNLRNQGYMKAPNYFCTDGSKGKTTCRNDSPSSPALRRILETRYFERNKTYYLRFKSAIESDVTQLMLDYFEFVPKNIYNGELPEDIW